MNSKTDQIFNAASVTEADIICLTETWLHPDVNNAELFPDYFRTFRDDRDFINTNTTRGGGVLLALNPEINSIKLDLSAIKSSVKHIDIVGAKITVSFTTVYIIVLYIPPNTSAYDYDLLFDNLLLLEFLYNQKVLLIGDFNLPNYNENINDNKSTILTNFMDLLKLQQFNHITNTNNRLLDLVLSNSNCVVSRDVLPFVNEDPHHPSLLIEFDIYSPASRRAEFALNKSLSKEFNFRKANYPLMYDKFLHADWSPILNERNVNLAVNKLNDIICDIFHETVPLKYNRKRRYPSWFTSEIIHLIKKKEAAHKKFKRTQLETDRHLFNYLRAEIKSKIQSANRNFIRSTETDIQNDPRAFWNYIKSKRDSSSLPGVMTNKDGLSFDDPQNIVNEFAKYFQSVYIQSNENYNINNAGNVGSGCIVLNKISEMDVIRAAKKLKPKNVSGVDNIPAFVVRDCINAFLEPILYIFNNILKTTVFPDTWKIARIRPILKKGDPAFITNYRSITVLCSFSKLFEILLYTLIYSQVENKISLDQHAFLSKKSCITNLACISQVISESIDANRQLDVVYTDFRKAFDQIDLFILISRLSEWGVSDGLLKLFKCYLFGRQHFVEIEGIKSHSFTPSSGVPQGSNLGPLLFIIFIDDLTNILSCPKLMYADDLKLYFEIKSVQDCHILQTNVSRLHEWCIANNMNLNVDKCNVMTFTRKHNFIQFPYKIGGNTLNRCDEGYRDLGVFFDQKLTFSFHISDIVSQANRNLGFIFRHSKGFNSLSTLKILYTAYVRSKLEYAALLWYPIYECYVTNIESVQRKFLKHLWFRTYRTFPERGIEYSILLNEFSFISLRTRRLYITCTFIHNLLNNKISCPQILDKINIRIPRLCSRKHLLFYCDAARTNARIRSPASIICHNFNSICDTCDIFYSSLEQVLTSILALTHNL